MLSKTLPLWENGFSGMPNEILEAICHLPLTDYESRCVHLLWRKTYGWQKHEDVIAYSQWSSGTGIDRRQVRRTLATLVSRQVINKKKFTLPGKNALLVWSFQGDWTRWNGYTSGQAELKLGAPVPLLTHELGASQPLVTEQVGVDTPPHRYKLGTKKGKVGAPLPPEVGAPLPPTKEKKDTITKESIYIEKTCYLDKVYLFPEEYEKLVKQFGSEGANERIKNLSLYIKSRGAEKRYKDHFATIQRWELDKKGGIDGKEQRSHGNRKDITKGHSADELRASVAPWARSSESSDV